MRNIFTLFILFVSLTTNVFAQDWLFTQQVRPRFNAGLRGVTLDNDTNLYITAFYRSSQGATLGNTVYNGITGISKTIPSTSDTKQDILIIKLNQTGDTLWTKNFGGTDSDYSGPVVIDNNNDPYIAGIFKSKSITLQSTTLTNHESNPAIFTNDIFIAKYTADGANSLVRRVAWGPNNQEANQIAIDGANNIYMIGSFVDSIFFNSDTLETHSVLGDTSMFLAKFKPNGNLRWAKLIPLSGGHSDYSKLSEISLANDHEIYLGGFFSGTINVDGIGITSQGLDEDFFIMKIDSTGATQWMRMGGTNGSTPVASTHLFADRCNGITANSNGDVYITGYFQGTAFFDSTGRGTLDSPPIVSAGSTDMFMAKYSPSGLLLWKKRNGSNLGDIAYGAKIRENILMFTGSFTGTVNFNNTTITSVPATVPDAGFFVYDTDGNPISAHSVTGTLDDRGEYIEYGLKGNTYFGGYFKSASLTVGSTTLTKNASRPVTSSDGFLAKFHNEFNATFSTHDDITCPGGNDGALLATSYFGTAPYIYDWSASTGTGTFNDSSATNLTAGFYSLSITDARDSVITITRTLTDPADFNVTLDSTNLSCFNAGDGSINLTASGGTGALTYTWNGPGVVNLITEDPTNLDAGTYRVVVRDTRNCTITDSILVIEPAPIYFGQVIVAPEEPSGSFSGSIDLAVTGGTLPYTYSWDFESVPMPGRSNDTLLNLQEGMYTAHIIDDNLCTADTNILVPGEALRVDLSPTHISCFNDNDGSAIAIVIAGDKGFSYLYTFEDNLHNPIIPVNDSVIVNLSPGWYYVTIDEQGGLNRSASDSVLITQPDSIDLTLTPVNVLCYNDNNGSIGLSVTGGTPSYSYSWSNGATTQNINTLTDGWYVVTVTDNHSCVAIDSAEVTEPADLIVSINLDHIVSCYNGTDGELSAIVSGGTPVYSYLWDDPGAQTTQIATNLAAGNYSVQVTDNNGCIANANMNLTQPQPLVFVSIDTIDVTCKDGTDGSISVELTGGVLPYSYEWSNSLPDTNFVGNLESLVTPYTLTVRDGNNCINDSLSYIVKEPADSLNIIIVDTTHNPCYGNALGNIEITGFGGWGTYEYSIDSLSWLPTGVYPDLSASIYRTFVRDYRGCTFARDIEIKQPDSLMATISVLNFISCANFNDARLLANVTGGIQPYSYTWDDVLNQTNDTAINLTAGTYNVLVTDINSCSDTAYRTLNQPTEIVINSVDTANIICMGGTDGHIGLTLQGGTPPYSYVWNPSQSDTSYIDNLPEGIYEVRTFDNNGCPGDTFIYQVKSPASALQIVEVTSSHINNLCFGDNIGELKVRASGGWGSYNFSSNLIDWQTDSVFVDLIALSYTISVRDTAGCIEDIGATITQPSQLIINSVVSGNSITAAGSGGTPPYSYSLNGGSWQSSGVYNNLASGTYRIQVRDDNNCGPVQTEDLIVETGVTETSLENAKIYPNPSNGMVSIELPGILNADILIEIYSLTGARIYSNIHSVSTEHENTIQIDLTYIPHGVFMVKIDGALLNTKLIKD